MSDAPEKNKKKSRPAPEAGSKQWYRRMWWTNVGLWITPVWPLFYITMNTEWSWPLKAIVAVTIPWVLVSVTLWTVSYALWRIEVNVEGNRENPFTPKDRKVLRRAILATMAAALAVVIAEPVLTIWMLPDAQAKAVAASHDGAFVVLLAIAMVAMTMCNIHRKGMQACAELKTARNELEQGV